MLVCVCVCFFVHPYRGIRTTAIHIAISCTSYICSMTVFTASACCAYPLLHTTRNVLCIASFRVCNPTFDGRRTLCAGGRALTLIPLEAT